MSSREDFLDRIAKALGRVPSSPQKPPQPGNFLPELGPVMPPIPPAELISKFESELQKVSGGAHRVSTPEELDRLLANLLKSYATHQVVLSRNPFLTQLGVAQRLHQLGITATAWPGSSPAAPGPGASQHFREEAFAAEVGITGVDLVLAESGTLVLTSLTEGAQLTSLAPPVHVALYRRNQVVATLEEVLERLPIARDSSSAAPGRSIVFVTGVSRTADIEQILICGVHGPRELHAILVDDSCL